MSESWEKRKKDNLQVFIFCVHTFLIDNHQWTFLYHLSVPSEEVTACNRYYFPSLQIQAVMESVYQMKMIRHNLSVTSGIEINLIELYPP